MMNKFTDIIKSLKVAIESEIATRKMYDKYAREASNPEMKRFFNYLAEYESIHQQFLEAELKALAVAQKDKGGKPSNWLRLLKEELNTNVASTLAETDENEDMNLAQCKLNLFVTDNIAQILEDANEELLQKQVRYEQELAIAADIQQKLLPQELLQDMGLQIAASNIMARTVGGDYSYLITNQRGQLSLIVADTMGKGIPASLLMTTVRAIWRGCSATCCRSPGQVIETINRAMYPDLSATGSFVTMFGAIYNPETSVFRYTNAGHYPPSFCPASVAEHKELDVGGLPVGVLSDARFPSAEVSMRKGDIIVIYTDGVVEAENGKEELFGFERLCNIIDGNRDSDAEDIKDAILSEVDSYIDGSPLADDTTLVVLKKC